MYKMGMILMAALAILLTGCAESATMAGNGASMVVACALLWSTVNIGRRRDMKE